MQFLRRDCADASGFAEALTAYRAYLRTIKNWLPPETYAYAAAEWHYDDGRRGPHDAWVESLQILEGPAREGASGRDTEISIRLLSAYQDRILEYLYKGVTAYTLIGPTPHRPRPSSGGHGGWLIDEVRLSEEGLVIHEIEFSNGCSWVITCRNLVHRDQRRG